jgi:hypothetical protein
VHDITILFLRPSIKTRIFNAARNEEIPDPCCNILTYTQTLQTYPTTVRVEVLMATIIKMAVFCYVVPCSLVDFNDVSDELTASIIRAASFIPEDSHLHILRTLTDRNIVTHNQYTYM